MGALSNYLNRAARSNTSFPYRSAFSLLIAAGLLAAAGRTGTPLPSTRTSVHRRPFYPPREEQARRSQNKNFLRQTEVSLRMFRAGRWIRWSCSCSPRW